MQHADDGYSRRRNVGASLVCDVVLPDSSDATNVYGSGGGEFEGTGSV